jgi:2'-5' RNA ligase
MFMVHLTVADFFQCPESAIDLVDSGLARVAEQSCRAAPQFRLSHQGVATFPQVIGNIFLDFATPQRPEALHSLHHRVIDLLKQTPGVVPNLRFVGTNYWPHLTLLQYAKLPPAVFEDAVQFARAVVADLPVPTVTQAWKLLLVRFESNVAGDNWDGGRWASDLRWNVLASYSL